MGVDGSFLPGRQDVSLHLSRPSVDILGRIDSLCPMPPHFSGHAFLAVGNGFSVCIGSILNLMVGSLDP